MLQLLLARNPHHRLIGQLELKETVFQSVDVVEYIDRRLLGGGLFVLGERTEDLGEVARFEKPFGLVFELFLFHRALELGELVFGLADQQIHAFFVREVEGAELGVEDRFIRSLRRIQIFRSKRIPGALLLLFQADAFDELAEVLYCPDSAV